MYNNLNYHTYLINLRPYIYVLYSYIIHVRPTPMIPVVRDRLSIAY